MPDLSGLLVLWLVFLGCLGLTIWAGSLPMAGVTLLVGAGAGWWTRAKRHQWRVAQGAVRRPREND
jgi:hypothetical protein